MGPSYAELTIRRRQTGTDRDDLALAEWFGGDAPSPMADETWSRILAGEPSETVRFKQWTDPSDVFPLLVRLLTEHVGPISGEDDEEGFGVSLGGVRSKSGGVFFNNAWKGNLGAGEGAEAWQILTPVRAGAHGTVELNRNIQRRFRARALEFARSSGWDDERPSRWVLRASSMATK